MSDKSARDLELASYLGYPGASAPEPQVVPSFQVSRHTLLFPEGAWRELALWFQGLSAWSDTLVVRAALAAFDVKLERRSTSEVSTYTDALRGQLSCPCETHLHAFDAINDERRQRRAASRRSPTSPTSDPGDDGGLAFEAGILAQAILLLTADRQPSGMATEGTASKREALLQLAVLCLVGVMRGNADPAEVRTAIAAAVMPTSLRGSGRVVPAGIGHGRAIRDPRSTLTKAPRQPYAARTAPGSGSWFSPRLVV